jgi:hypothetical protein
VVFCLPPSFRERHIAASQTEQREQAQKVKAKEDPYLKFADVPLRYLDELGETLAVHSVALGHPTNADGTKFEIYASGALVCKGNRFGVLTARHCMQKPGQEIRGGSSDGDPLLLVLQCCHRVVVPPKALVRHALAIPYENELEPDVAFLEILPGPQLSSIKAIASFCSLDEDPAAIEQEFANAGMPFSVIGFTEASYHTKIRESAARNTIKYMTFSYGIDSAGISERDGWDYIEANNLYGGKNEPKSFKGIGSGPVWGLQITRDKGTRLYTLEKFALIGIAFLNVRITAARVLVRAHFIRSIYDRAWKEMRDMEGHK